MLFAHLCKHYNKNFKNLFISPSRSRSAIRSHWPLTSSTLRRLMPPLSPLAHAARGDPMYSRYSFNRMGGEILLISYVLIYLLALRAEILLISFFALSYAFSMYSVINYHHFLALHTMPTELVHWIWWNVAVNFSESLQLRFSGVVSDVPDTRSGGNWFRRTLHSCLQDNFCNKIYKISRAAPLRVGAIPIILCYFQ